MDGTPGVVGLDASTLVAKDRRLKSPLPLGEGWVRVRQPAQTPPTLSLPVIIVLDTVTQAVQQATAYPKWVKTP